MRFVAGRCAEAELLAGQGAVAERHREAVAGRGAVAARHQEAAAGRGAAEQDAAGREEQGCIGKQQPAEKTQGCIGKMLLAGGA